MKKALAVVTVLAVAGGCSRSSEAAPSREHAERAEQGERSATGAAKPGPAAGSHVESKTFKLDAVADATCRAKQDCKVALKLLAIGDFHINKEYPYKFKAEGQGVTFTGTDAAGPNVFTKAAGDFVVADEHNATMTVKFKADKVGPVTISGTYKMSVCSKDSCQLETQELSVVVPVT